MFKISPVQDFAEQIKIAAICKAEAKEGYFSYVMRDCDTLDVMGFAQFEIGKDGFISDLRQTPGLDDFEAMFILGRSTMNFINICGADSCRAALDAGDERLLRAIGFKETDGEYFCNMTGMFDGSHCSGEAVKL